MLSRRRFLELSGGALGTAALGCSALSTETDSFTLEDMTLRSRPHAPSGSIGPGLHPLELDWARDGFIYVPPTYAPSKPAPVVMLLHGATQSSLFWSNAPLSKLVDDLGI